MRTDFPAQANPYLSPRPAVDAAAREASRGRETASTGRRPVPPTPALPGQGYYAPTEPELIRAMGGALPPPSLLAETAVPLAAELFGEPGAGVADAGDGAAPQPEGPPPLPGQTPDRDTRRGQAAGEIPPNAGNVRATAAAPNRRGAAEGATPAVPGGDEGERAPTPDSVEGVISPASVRAAAGAAPAAASAVGGTPADEAAPVGEPGAGTETPPAGEASADPESELTPEEQNEVEELQRRDREVRQHEQAHMAAAGGYARGGASYEYATGPDNRRYAVGGEVSIDTSRESEPEATIRKAQIIYSAALAPAEPSGQDRQVASEAKKMEAEARQELSRKRREENAPSEEATEADGTEAAEDVEGATAQAEGSAPGTDAPGSTPRRVSEAGEALGDGGPGTEASAAGEMSPGQPAPPIPEPGDVQAGAGAIAAGDGTEALGEVHAFDAGLPEGRAADGHRPSIRPVAGPAERDEPEKPGDPGEPIRPGGLGVSIDVLG